MIAIFVDDLFIIGNSIPKIKVAKAIIHVHLQILDLKLCKYCGGMTIIRGCKNRIL